MRHLVRHESGTKRRYLVDPLSVETRAVSGTDLPDRALQLRLIIEIISHGREN